METSPLKYLFLGIFFCTPAFALEAFKIELHDRKIRVEAPKSVSSQYSVIVENLSLNDVVGKFHSAGKDLKFVNVKAGLTRTVEFRHAGKGAVRFQPLAPAFQEVELIAGKKSYEIPSQP